MQVPWVRIKKLFFVLWPIFVIFFPLENLWAKETDFFFESPELLSATSAARHEALFSLEPGVLSSLSAKEIEILSPEEIYSVLSYLPGVFVAYSSAGYANVYLHGGTGPFSPMLVLIDGYPINIELLGIPVWPFMLIFPDEIERIEVVRSPASVYFGSYALTGAINIITKPPEEQKGTSIQLACGTQDYKRGSFSFSKHLGPWHFYTNLSRQETNGFSRADRSLEKQAIHLDLSRVKENYTLRILGGFYSGEAENIYTDIFLGQELHLDGKDIYFRYLRASLEGRTWHLRLAGDFAGGDLISRNLSALSGHYEQSTYRLQYNKFLYLRRQKINSGFDISIFHAKGKFLRDINQFKYALFTEDYIDLSRKIDILAGLRLNHHPISGFFFSPRLSLIIEPTNNSSFRYSYTKSFGNPIILFTNMDIKNEPIAPGTFLNGKSKKINYISQSSHEASFTYKYKFLKLLLSYFQYKIKDLPYILPEYIINPSNYTTNINLTTVYKKEKIEGYDIDAKLNLPRNINFRLSYEHLSVKNRCENSYILRYPKHLLSILLTKREKKYSYYIGTNYIGKREWQDIKMGDILNLNLGANWYLTKNLTISFSIYNLFNDHEREDPLGEELERRIFIRLKYVWK